MIKLTQYSKRGVLGHFLTPDEAMGAATKLRDSDYTHFDFLTPFPIHGMEKAMGQKPSWIPYVAAALAVLGILAAQAMQNYVMAIDWPMNFGGKPAVAWPSFIPITFEAMVFFGAIGSAIVAIIAGKKDSVPQPPPMAIKTGATIDRFVLWISATDPFYDEAAVLDFTSSLGAHEVHAVDAEGEQHA
jgi:Alternative complex III, ActD subunit